MLPICTHLAHSAKDVAFSTGVVLRVLCDHFHNAQQFRGDSLALRNGFRFFDETLAPAFKAGRPWLCPGGYGSAKLPPGKVARATAGASTRVGTPR